MELIKTRKLKSNDGQIFEVDEKILEISTVLKNLAIDFPEPEYELPTNEVDGKTLSKIIDYLKEYKDKKPKEIPKPLPNDDLESLISKWDAQFIMPLSLEECVDLVNAANFLDIPDLVNLSTARLAYELINCPIEEAKQKFGVIDDMTIEEMGENEKYPFD